MNKVFLSPSKVVIGSGALLDLGNHIAQYGKKALLLAHAEDSARVSSILKESCNAANVTLVDAHFRGECTHEQVTLAESLLKDKEIRCVVGLGGGKAIDTAKILADKCALPVFSVPTIVSTDAPCSSMAVVYDEQHNYVENYMMSRGPALVLVDSQIIANAPLRFLVAGIGDGLATCYEAEACLRVRGANYGGGLATQSAMELARLCKKTLWQDAPAAIQAVHNKLVTPALENVIEANTLMSGIGFESVGLAAAHCVDTMLFMLGARGALHGEQVAFGLLVQLVLENRGLEEIKKTVEFYQLVGLPLCLKDVGIEKEGISKEQWDEALTFSKQPYSTMRHMGGNWTKDDFKNAILMADILHTL